MEHCSFQFLFLLPLSNLFHCLCRDLLYSKTPKQVFFNPINIFDSFTTLYYCFFSDENVGRWIEPGTTTHNRTLPGPPNFQQNVDCTNDDCEADTRACHPGFACAPYEFGLEICKLQHKQAEKEWEKKYPNVPYDPNKLTDCKTALQPEEGTNNKGFCIPCELGQYCPDGTITKGYSLFENRCPPGKLCRAPNVMETCPGMFFFFHFLLLPSFFSVKNY